MRKDWTQEELHTLLDAAIAEKPWKGAYYTLVRSLSNYAIAIYGIMLLVILHLAEYSAVGVYTCFVGIILCARNLRYKATEVQKESFDAPLEEPHKGHWRQILAPYFLGIICIFLVAWFYQFLALSNNGYLYICCTIMLFLFSHAWKATNGYPQQSPYHLGNDFGYDEIELKRLKQTDVCFNEAEVFLFPLSFSQRGRLLRKIAAYVACALILLLIGSTPLLLPSLEAGVIAQFLFANAFWCALLFAFIAPKSALQISFESIAIRIRSQLEQPN